MKIRAFLIAIIALSGCHTATSPPLPPPTPQQAVGPLPVLMEMHQSIRRREAHARDHALIQSSARSLDRAQKRLDWLNGRDPVQ